jgi:hypothetical protein
MAQQESQVLAAQPIQVYSDTAYARIAAAQHKYEDIGTVFCHNSFTP